MSEPLDPQAALIQTMVLASAANGDMSDREIEAMGHIIQELPVFTGFDRHRLVEVGRDCADLLREEDGLDTALEAIRVALTPRLRETAYALACDVVASDGRSVGQESLRLLEMLRDSLGIERLAAAGIERGTQARFARL